MKVLVIDTALGACTVAVFDGDRPLAVRHELMTKGHSERIAGLARDVMAEAGVGFDRLDRIGVTVGPGSFTGLRVGLAFAQGRGEALDRPVVGISTLEALARSVDLDPSAQIAAAIDARRGQVYLQTFGAAGTNGPQALDVQAAQTLLSQTGEWIVVGSGAEVLGMGSGPSSDVARPVNPSPRALAALTIAADPARSPPRPLYLRAPDATPPTRLPGQPRAAAVGS